MALAGSPTMISSAWRFGPGIKLFKAQPRPHTCLVLRACQRISPTCSAKITKAQFDDPSKVKLQFSAIKERVLEATPDSVKSFPWRKAEDALLKRLLVVGRKVLKWSVVTLFVFSFLSDVIFSILRNLELMIPFGLLAGCLMSDFFKEVAQEMVHTTEENGLKPSLLGISCLFVLVKIISTFFTVKYQVFLLHVSNGGLLQALWLWKKLSNGNYQGNEETSVT